MIKFEFSKNNSAPRFTMDRNGNIGIGTNAPSMPITVLDEWFEIHKLAETNDAVNSALDMLKTTYYLAKNNGSKT